MHDDGSGPALYVGGAFGTAGGASASRIARWDGSSWTPLGAGVSGVAAATHALAIFDDGSGAALYAAGHFTMAGGASANRIARWDGSSWTPLGSGTDDRVYALAAYDDGSGAVLYGGGGFIEAGGVPVSNLAAWDGSSWSATGTGMNGAVRAVTEYDDGAGPALYAAGEFTGVDGVQASKIARWDGASWSPLESGVNGGTIYALQSFDDGDGAALYAGGNFSSAGGAAASGIAGWDGSSWAPLGAGVSGGGAVTVNALAVHDDGNGAALYVGGHFANAGNQSANHIAKWDGNSWSVLGSGITGGTLGGQPWVYALAVYDDGRGSGPALYAAGRFTYGWRGAVTADRTMGR